jgi:hypothetical protein
MTSLNQLIDKFYQVSVAHPQVNGFGFGPIYDIVGQEINYPYLWISEETHTMNYSESNSIYNSIDYVLVLRVADKVNDQPNVYEANGENSNNGLEVLSDTMQILVDVVNSMAQDSLNIFNEVEILEDISVEHIEHEDSGDVNGHTVTITLRVINNSQCVTPLTPGGATSLVNNLFLKGIFNATQSTLEPITIDNDNAGTYITETGDLLSGTFTYDINGGGYNSFAAPFVLSTGDVLTAQRTGTGSAGFYKIIGYYL